MKTTIDQIISAFGPIATSEEDLWAGMPGLVWSNPKASNEARIAAALLNPRFNQLLAIAAYFGTERLQEVWSTLVEESPDEANRIASHTERILANIREGARRAYAGN